MDGRAVSPDHLHGATQEQFVLASQGQWKDGSPIGYPGCKEYAPLPLDRVAHPGGYPNADGYNIMHDCCPGDLRTDEARGLLANRCPRAADLVLHLHSPSIGGQALGASLFAYPMTSSGRTPTSSASTTPVAAAGLRPAKVYPSSSPAVSTGGRLRDGQRGSRSSRGNPRRNGLTFENRWRSLCHARDLPPPGPSEPFSPRLDTARGRT